MKLTTFYNIGQKYALSINPSDKYQYFSTPKRYRKVHSHLYNELQGLTCYYKLYIEISEPNQQLFPPFQGARIHAHGYIVFRTRKELGKFLEHDLTRLLKTHTLKITTIENTDLWLKYCQKQHIYKDNILTNYISSPTDDVSN